jgi:hypothetical protein
MKPLRKEHDMGKYIRPSAWGMKAIDVLFVFILFALVLRFIAPTSGLALAIHTFCGWLAAGVTWVSIYLARFLTWI